MCSSSVVYQEYKRYKLLKKYQQKKLKTGLRTQIAHTAIGFNVYIGSDSSLINSQIGDYSYINAHVSIKNTTIGKFCSIGPGVKIELGNHPVHFVSSHPAFYANNKPFDTFAKNTCFEEYRQVIIGNDVWIGENVLIPGGVNIGDGAVITAGAVVTKNVEPYAIVGGVPAKIIRYRFDERTRKIIHESKWWEKDEEWLRKNHLLFHDAEAFIHHVEQGT
ncbi:CatB-related O-acetyltransferase [Pedobacter sp. BS3]|nr:CatB-related O-acetyltransferase [Pedobacter sp. BS3]